MAQAEALFSVKFYEFSHPQMSTSVVRCLDVPVIPEPLTSIIESVPSFGYLMGPSSKYSKARASPAGAETLPVNYGVVPQTLRQLYVPPDLSLRFPFDFLLLFINSSPPTGTKFLLMLNV